MAENPEWYQLVLDGQHGDGRITHISGYCSTISKHLELASEIGCEIGVLEPVLIRPFSKTGVFEVSYPFVEVGSSTVSTRHDLFYPTQYATLQQWRQAWAGDPEAQNELGYSYSYRWDDVGPIGDAMKDYAVASYWFSKAAAVGHGSALNNMGYLYAHGLGWEPDAALAASYFRKAATRLVAEAFGNLTTLLGEDDVSKATGQVLDVVQELLSSLPPLLSQLEGEVRRGAQDQALGTIAAIRAILRC